MQEIQWQQMTLRDYWQMILRRKWQILLPFLLIPLLVIPGSFFLTPMYRAQTVLISEEVERGSILKGLASLPVPTQERADIVKQKIYSRPYITQVADNLNVREHLESLRPNEMIATEDVLRYLRNKVDVKLLSGKFTEISVVHAIPEKAAEIANEVAKVYVDNTLQRRQREVTASYNFIRDQLDEYKQRLTESEQQLAEAKESGILESLTDDNAALIELVTKAEAELVGLEVDINNAKTEISRLRAMIPPGTGEGDYYIYTDPRIKQLQSQIDIMEAERIKLLRKYDPQWPSVQALNSELKNLYAELENLRTTSAERVNVSAKLREQERLLAEYEIQKNRLRVQKGQYQQKLDQLPLVQLRLSALIREKMTNEKVYDLLLSRLNEAEILQSSELREMGSIAEVFDEALVPERPFKPDRRSIAMIAVAIGLALGLGGALVLEMFDHSIRSLDEASRFFPDTPTIGIIPEIETPEVVRRRRRNRILKWSGLGILTLLLLGLAIDLMLVRFQGQTSYAAAFIEYAVGLMEELANYKG